MNFPWFRRKGLLFIPVNEAGWIILFVGLAYAVFVFIDIDSRSHSASDTLMNFAFNLFFIVAGYSLIGLFTSGKGKK